MGYKMNGFSGFGNSPMKQDETTKEPPVAHSDTTTVGNPITPSMIDFLGRQGLSKIEINALHKAHEKKLKKKKEE
jgi:hypothetical protein